MLRLGTLCALGLFAACMSTPTGDPTSAFNEFDFWAGPKVLEISGGDLLPDSAASTGCFPRGPPNGNKFVYTRIDLEPANGQWIAKSLTPADGEVTLTLRTAGPAIGGHVVAGTISGSAISVIATGGASTSPSRVQIVFDSTSPQDVEGEGATIGVFVQGTIAGTSKFVDTTGAQSVCGRVYWTLQALPPGS